MLTDDCTLTGGVEIRVVLDEKLVGWGDFDSVSAERFPTDGNADRPIQYGMPRWRDLFPPRRLPCLGQRRPSAREPGVPALRRYCKNRGSDNRPESREAGPPRRPCNQQRREGRGDGQRERRRGPGAAYVPTTPSSGLLAVA